MSFLLRRRNQIVRSGVLAGHAAGIIARSLQSELYIALVNLRKTARSYGLRRLLAELNSLGLQPSIAVDGLKTLAEDAARARYSASSYAQYWLAKATRLGSPDAASAATDARLSMIAETEAFEAFTSERNHAAEILAGILLLLGGPDEEIKLFKRWDAKLEACPVCAAADGTLVPVGQNFVQGEPGTVHPRCRCSWSLVKK